LSATEPNSEQLRPLQPAEERRVHPELSGWGAGGRRFKSCLPDRTKAPLSGAFGVLAVARHEGWGTQVWFELARTDVP
jgi:hypothetical protein